MILLLLAIMTICLIAGYKHAARSSDAEYQRRKEKRAATAAGVVVGTLLVAEDVIKNSDSGQE